MQGVLEKLICRYFVEFAVFSLWFSNGFAYIVMFSFFMLP